MNQNPLTAIVAATPSGVIGRDGTMPWHLRRDLQRFKRLTMGHVLVMGRTTFESIGKPLPGRRTIVVTRNPNYEASGVDIANNVTSTLDLIGSDRGFVVGGAQIYSLFLNYCEQLWLTRVWSGVAGDTHLHMNLDEFEPFLRSRIPASPQDDVPTEFLRLRRRKH